jgi:hypothetical protein
MVFAADKSATAVLLWERNIVPWLISWTDKFKNVAQQTALKKQNLEQCGNTKTIASKHIQDDENGRKRSKTILQYRKTKAVGSGYIYILAIKEYKK